MNEEAEETLTVTFSRPALDDIWGELMDNDWLWSNHADTMRSISIALYGPYEDAEEPA